jgi:hypothetical protein
MCRRVCVLIVDLITHADQTSVAYAGLRPGDMANVSGREERRSVTPMEDDEDRLVQQIRQEAMTGSYMN